jgi:hypothetical protein
MIGVLDAVRRLLRGKRRPADPPAPRRHIDLSSLTPAEADEILQALRAAGHLRHVYTEAGYPRVGTDELDHAVHAMRMSGDLARLSKAQVDNVLAALRAAGHLRDLYTEGGYPRVGTDELDHAVHAMRMNGELARLSRSQVDNVLVALREAGLLGHLYTEAGYPRVGTDELDHAVHAMRMRGDLARLSKAQVDNVFFALQAAGHLGHLRDLSRASYDDGHLISFYNADFLDEPRFQEAYRLGQQTDSWQGFDVRWRAYVVCWAAAHGSRLRGDFVECGVNRGGHGRAIMHYVDFASMHDRHFYLLDTYCGIPEQDRDPASAYYHSAYRDCYESVVRTFRPFRNAHVIRGRVPDTLDQVPSRRVCFLSIDMNCVGPEIAAAEFFWDRLLPGAVVLLDDYGAGVWHLPQKHAFDEFARRKGVEILSLPTCQGLLIKP